MGLVSDVMGDEFWENLDPEKFDQDAEAEMRLLKEVKANCIEMSKNLFGRESWENYD